MAISSKKASVSHGNFWKLLDFKHRATIIALSVAISLALQIQSLYQSQILTQTLNGLFQFHFKCSFIYYAQENKDLPCSTTYKLWSHFYLFIWQNIAFYFHTVFKNQSDLYSLIPHQWFNFFILSNNTLGQYTNKIFLNVATYNNIIMYLLVTFFH